VERTTNTHFSLRYVRVWKLWWKSLTPLPGIKPRFLSQPARSYSRYPSSWVWVHLGELFNRLWRKNAGSKYTDLIGKTLLHIDNCTYPKYIVTFADWPNSGKPQGSSPFKTAHIMQTILRQREFEDSLGLLHSQNPGEGPFPRPNECSPHQHTYLCNVKFSYYSAINVQVFPLVSFLRVFRLNLYIHFSYIQ